jgi:hypothetical protein
MAMALNDIEHRLQMMAARIRAVYDGLGHSSGRPYVYFVYPPSQERSIRRLVDDYLVSDQYVYYHHIDVLPIAISSLGGQEDKRKQLLDANPSAAESIVRLWGRRITEQIQALLQEQVDAGKLGRPVIVLQGLAALHPLGNPTGLMEEVAEQEPRDPRTNAIVPIVLMVPGVRPPQTSRCYLFLGLERERLDFYRGEEL